MLFRLPFSLSIFCLLSAIGCSSFTDVETAAGTENLENAEMDGIEHEESTRLYLRRRAKPSSCTYYKPFYYCTNPTCTHTAVCPNGKIKDVSRNIESGEILDCTIGEQSMSCSVRSYVGKLTKTYFQYSCCTDPPLYETTAAAPMGYYIFNTESGRILDVDANTGCVDGTNVQLWDFLGSPNQRFHIESGRIVNDMCNKALQPDSGICSNQRNVQLSTKSSVLSQQWNVDEASDTSVTNKACDDTGLDIVGFGTDNGSNIQLYQFFNNWNQKWVFKPARFHLVNPQTGKVLDVDSNQNCADGSTIQIWDKFGSAPNQAFHFEAVYWDEQYVGDMIVSDACNKAIDVTAGNCGGGASVQLYSKNRGESQVFKLQGDGTVLHVVCDQVLDIKDYGSENGSTLQIYSNLQGWNQQWEVQYIW